MLYVEQFFCLEKYIYLYSISNLCFIYDEFIYLLHITLQMNAWQGEQTGTVHHLSKYGLVKWIPYPKIEINISIFENYIHFEN